MQAIMASAPVKIPAPPSPAMALPTMNMSDDVAAPQMADPTSNSTQKTAKDHWKSIVSLVGHHGLGLRTEISPTLLLKCV
jgi:hypothetical protein